MTAGFSAGSSDGSSRTWMALIKAWPLYEIVNSSVVASAVNWQISEPPYSHPVPANLATVVPSGAVADCVV